MAKRAQAGSGRKGTPKNQDAADTPANGAGSLARLHVWQFQAVRDLLIVAAVIGIFWAGYALRAVTVPLLVALLLAYLFDPLINRLCQHPRIRRPVAVAGLLTTVGAALVIVLAIVLPVAAGQTMRFVGDIRGGMLHERVSGLERFVPEAYRQDFGELLDMLPSGAKDTGAPVAEAIPFVADAPADTAGPKDSIGAPATPADTEALRALIDQRVNERFEAQLDARLDERLDERLAMQGDADAAPGEPAGWLDFTQGSLDAIFGVLGSIVQLGLLTFLIPFYFFFFSVWYPDVVEFGRELIPKRHKEHTLDLLGKMDRVVAGFVRGRIVISLIMGAMLAIGWMICGVPYAIVLGLVVGVFCAVPYLGTIGIPLAVALLFFDTLGDPNKGDLWWVWVIVWPTVVFAIVQLVEGYALTPMIAGKATNLDPVTILVAVLAGGSVLGVYGMLLAIPLAACAKILCTEMLLPDIRAWVRGERKDPLPIDVE